MTSGPPPPLVFLRIAGLPAAVIEHFSTNLCRHELSDLWAALLHLERRRKEMALHLEKLIPSSPPRLRRLCLALRRDCFNGRLLESERNGTRWRDLQEAVGPELEQLLAAQDLASQTRERFEATYDREWRREAGELLLLTEDQGFRRGLTLASPGLIEAVGRPDVSGAPRKVRKLETSLLRYASRTALKLSPYSTLTRVSLGHAVETPEGAGVRLIGALSGWHERSLVRVRRYLVEQDLAMLLRYSGFRDRLEVMLNDTCEEISPGVFRLVRPGAWEPSRQGTTLRFIPPSVYEIREIGQLLSLVREHLNGRPLSYAELVTEVERVIGWAGAASRVAVDGLIRAGLLLFRLPWASNEPHLERALLDHLRSLPADPRLSQVTAILEPLVHREEAFSSCDCPADWVKEIERLLQALWQVTAPLGGLPPEVERFRVKAVEICEDVLLQPPAASSIPTLLRLPMDNMDQIVRSVTPWARLVALREYRLDFLHTLAGWAAGRWPGREEVGFLELFTAAQPLWRQYRAFLSSAAVGGSMASFNPLDLECVANLERLREDLWGRVKGLLAEVPADEVVSPDSFEPLLALLPPGYEPMVPPCLLLQPADAHGRLWVLNRMFEGTGRYGSRFTALMEEPARDLYTARLARRSRVETADGPAELIDLLWSRMDTLNVHAVQTARVISIPGETLSPNVVSVDLRELCVRLCSDSRLPRLVDRAGVRLLPVHLGGASTAYLPSLLQFLALWGPGELLSPRPPVPLRQDGEIQVENRVTVGNVVLLRKRWILPSSGLQDSLRNLGGGGGFAALNRWRMDRGLPDRLFWIERVRHEQASRSLYKPQYLDWTSPHFAEAFRSALDSQGDTLTFEEMLPSLEVLPRDDSGTSWAVEVHLETLMHGEERRS